MSVSLSRGSGYICRSCRIQQAVRTAPLSYTAASQLDPPKTYRSHDSLQRRCASNRVPPGPNAKFSRVLPPTSRSPSKTQLQSKPDASVLNESTSPVPIDTTDASGTLNQLRWEVNTIAASDQVPGPAEVLEVLDRSYQFANLLVFGSAVAPEEERKPTTPPDREDGSLLLDLEEPSVSSHSSSPSSAQQPPQTPPSTTPSFTSSFRERAAVELCKTIHGLLKDPKIEITEDILSIYVRIVCQLARPEYLPEVFFLYANKPLPKPNTKPIRYTNPNPNAANSAIPQNLSDAALDAAIIQRDLPLAIAIIDHTVGARAFRRNKFLKKGSLPLAAVGSTPLVAWAGAEWVAQWQNTFDPMMSKYMTMMGAMAYIGTLGTIGFIALTTWNDHHDRVVWTPGTPLRERWSREEERMYFDRIAVAWGFQSRHRRGEESGEEWEALRNVIGERSMILDKSDLLEGMQ